LFARNAEHHLRLLTARQRATVFSGIHQHLSEAPLQEARNRKPMRANLIAPWELRLGSLRVYYDASAEPEPIVRVLAVGVKLRNRVLVGQEELKL
jgi:hypothetical protein